MLLITRRVGESIIINGGIEVSVVEVRGGRVKLGFEYPEGNTIYRKELFLKITEENRQAATAKEGIGSISDLIAKIKTKPKGDK